VKNGTIAQNIYIDARGLNYGKRTGVNVFTLNSLHVLLEAVDPITTQIFLVGIDQHVFDSIINEFDMFNNNTVSRMSLQQYLNVPTFVSNTVLGLLLEVGNFMLPRRWFDRLFRPSINGGVMWQPNYKALSVGSEMTLLITIHDLFHSKYKQVIRGVRRIRDNKYSIKKSLSRAQRIIADSYSTAKDISELFGYSDTIRVVYPGPNTLLINTSKKRVDNDFPQHYFLALSGIEYRKNWHNIIYAHYYNVMHQPEYTATLYLAGIPVDQSYLEKLKSIVTENAIPRVILDTNVDESKKQSLLTGALAVVYPSLYEGFGYPILEAYSFSKAVITSQMSSMPEIAQDGAMYVNPLDIVEIAHALYIMQVDTKFRQKLESRTSLILKNYTWNEYRHLWEDVLTNEVN
jgi:glycosyltransferase involved in cell wall biosynthesis